MTLPRPVSLAASAALYALAALLAARAGVWAWASYASDAWWALIAVLSFAGASLAAWFCFADAKTWAQARVPWRDVLFNVGGFVLGLLYFGSVWWYIVSRQEWVN